MPALITAAGPVRLALICASDFAAIVECGTCRWRYQGADKAEAWAKAARHALDIHADRPAYLSANAKARTAHRRIYGAAGLERP